MSHPLLTKVLADAYAVEFPPIEVPGYIDPANRLREQQAFMERVTAAIPPDIADRLERALDVCVEPNCIGNTAHGPVEDGCRHPEEHHRRKPLVAP